jgi:hypothetical protein
MESKNDGFSSGRTKGIWGGGVSSIDAAAGHPPIAANTNPSLRTKDKLFTRFLRWLYPDQRKTHRHTFPPIVSYLGTLLTSPPYRVGDVSLSGFYMLTTERWLPDTEMPVTLLRIDVEGNKSKESITLLSKVVRTGPDGVGFAFVLNDCGKSAARSLESKSTSSHPEGWASRKDVEKFLEGLKLSEFEILELEGVS